LCGLAYSSTSATMLAKESYYENIFNAANDLLYSFWMYEKDYINFNFKNNQLKSQAVPLTLSLATYNTQNLGLDM
jgi:hypothetical protein